MLLALLCGLGFWQLDRAAGKEERKNAFESARAVVLDERALAREPYEFARVELHGRYDAAHQFLQDNRTHRGRAGYQVLTPLRTPRNGAVLVSRGWVPADPDRTSLPDVAVPAGALRVRGTVRLPREDLLVLGETGYAGSGWPRVVQRVEIAAMQRSLGYPLATWLVAWTRPPPTATYGTGRWLPGSPLRGIADMHFNGLRLRRHCS